MAVGGSTIPLGFIKSAHTVGPRNDGTVVAVVRSFVAQCNVVSWMDTVQVVADGGHMVGLESDGTVVAAGWTEYEQCNVSDWDLS